jgi:hypothetical protein
LIKHPIRLRFHQQYDVAQLLWKCAPDPGGGRATTKTGSLTRWCSPLVLSAIAKFDGFSTATSFEQWSYLLKSQANKVFLQIIQKDRAVKLFFSSLSRRDGIWTSQPKPDIQ